MRRETQNVLLILVGAVLMKIVLDGTYLRYVKPWSAPVVFAAGAVLVALALVAITRDVRAHVGPGGDPAAGEDHDHGHDHDHDHDHGHGHGGSRASWLLALPVLALLLVAPPALGSAALSGSGERSVAVSDGGARGDSIPLPPGEAPTLDLLDVVRHTAADPHGPITTRDVTTLGFLVPSARPGASGTDVARLTITCCAADASAVRVHLADPHGLLGRLGPAPPGGGDRWVSVRGRVVAGTGTAADGHVPTLTVTDLSPVAPPDPVYEY